MIARIRDPNITHTVSIMGLNVLLYQEAKTTTTPKLLAKRLLLKNTR